VPGLLWLLPPVVAAPRPVSRTRQPAVQADPARPLPIRHRDRRESTRESNGRAFPRSAARAFADDSKSNRSSVA
jgi:hypothetical protein